MASRLESSEEREEVEEWEGEGGGREGGAEPVWGTSLHRTTSSAGCGRKRENINLRFPEERSRRQVQWNNEMNNESIGTANFFHYLEVFFIERYKFIEEYATGIHIGKISL